MQDAPCVSVIVTVYKRTNYLAQALRSVLAQSYKDYEILVVDDSGQALARQIVTECADSSRVRYIANPITMGVASSLVGAVRQARGEFISILNDDDLWEEDLLQKLVPPLLADRNRVLATSDHWIMDVNGNIDRLLSEQWSVDFGRSRLAEGSIANTAEFAVAMGGPAINLSSVFRKDAFDWSLVVPEVKGAYDYWVSCLLAATRKPFYYVPARLGRWRIHEHMETSRRSHDKGENMVYIYSTLLERRWFPELEGPLKQKLADALFVVGRDKLRFDRTREARRCFWRSFLLSGTIQSLLRILATWLPKALRALISSSLEKFRSPKKAVGF